MIIDGLALWQGLFWPVLGVVFAAFEGELRYVNCGYSVYRICRRFGVVSGEND